MDGIFKIFGGYFIILALINLLFLGALIFFGVKACDYVTSGEAASHIQQIQESEEPTSQRSTE